MTPMPPAGVEDRRIRTQLAGLQTSLEPALQDGGELLASFHKSLNDLLRTTKSSEDLHEETHFMVASFAQVVKTISAALLESIDASEAVHQALDREILRLAEADFKFLSIGDASPLTLRSAPYASVCFQWLIQHLHNPYPSKKLRADMAHDTDSSEKEIDTWFLDARKEIGWNSLRRSYFETRADMVKAATQHFKPKSRPARPTPYTRFKVEATEQAHTDFSSHFATMEDRARALHPESWNKFDQESISSNKAFLSAEKSIHLELTDPTLAYPSPEPSPSPSQSTNNNPTSTVTHTIAHTPKRRRSPEVFERESTPRLQRPLKRTRIADSFNSSCRLPSSIIFDGGLSKELYESMSPAPLVPNHDLPSNKQKRKRRSSDASDDSDSSHVTRGRIRRRVDEDDTDPSPVSMSQLQQVPVSAQASAATLKRKRRLSDAHDKRPRKLPHHVALMVPRLHTVSNPLPAPSLFADLEDIPPTLPAELPTFSKTVDFDDLQNVDVESFDYGSIPLLKDYLSQLDTAAHSIDNSNIVTSETHPSSARQGSAGGMDSLPLLNLNLEFSPADQLSLSSYDGLFCDLQGLPHTIAPAAEHNILSTVDKPSTTLDQIFDPTFYHDASAPVMHSSGINPFDLMLHPSTSITPTHVASLAMVADNRSSSLGSAFGDASQATFAIQKIQALQAELEMCKNQLVQCGMFPF